MQKDQTGDLIAVTDEELSSISGGAQCRRLCHPVYRHGRAIGKRCVTICQ